MDLTVVAQMIGRGEQPNLFELQEQQYGLMAADYAGKHTGREFPLQEFAARVYEMRLADEPAFATGEFVNELTVMARPEHKMVVPYHDLGAGADAAPRWRFRHDKIMDFFLVQAFLGPDNDRPGKHLGEARFRGTYLQLADLMPVADAEALERLLVDHAADTRDHSLSDDFVQRLRPRRAHQADLPQATAAE